MNGKGYGGWLEVWVGTKRTNKVKQTLKRSKLRPSEGLVREAKREGQEPAERCVTVGEVPI